MASNWTVCGVCDSLEITKPAGVWCSECDEGLCTACDKHHAVSKASRTHSTIPISEYNKLPTDILQITHNCIRHNEKFQTYCRKHDCPCCHICVIENHNDCKDITAIDDIIKDIKSSSALYDIELVLVEVAENLEKITKDRINNLTSLKDQRRRIENEIKQTRMKINSHLDQIQDDLIKELNITEDRERKKIEDLLTSLEKTKKKFNVHKTTISNVKQYASEFQTFLAMKTMETNVSNKERFLETLATSKSLRQIALSVKYDGALQTIYNFKSIGHIEVEMIPSEIIMTRMKRKQAQLEVISKSARLIEDIQLNLKQTIKTGLSQTTGCIILPDNRLVLSCRGNNIVRVFKNDGNKDFEIVLEPLNIIDIAFDSENNTIVATSGESGEHFINIINMKDRKISRQISVNSSYYGVVYSECRLVTCAKDKGLHIIKKGRGEVIEEIKNKEISAFAYVAAFANKLYYTNINLHTVTCCDMKGKELWTFKDKSVLKSPRGITVDNDGNIYVSSCGTFKVIVISSDGKRCLELLSAKDGLYNPRVLHYDRSTNQLLVTNTGDTALLFHVTTKNYKPINTTWR